MKETRHITKKEMRLEEDVRKNMSILTNTLRSMSWETEAIAVAFEEIATIMFGTCIPKKKNIKIACERMQSRAEKIWSKRHGKNEIGESDLTDEKTDNT